jgi:hypothetical protein
MHQITNFRGSVNVVGENTNGGRKKFSVVGENTNNNGRKSCMHQITNFRLALLVLLVKTPTTAEIKT